MGETCNSGVKNWEGDVGMCTVAAMSSIISRASTFRRVLFAGLPLAVALAGSLASHAYAAEGSQYGQIGQYGEVTRFGGFDATWFDGGKYDGKGATPGETEPAAGKFVDPAGFAVDTDDEGKGTTAIYVLDSVSGWAEELGTQGSEWRLQKLSATGTVLGSTEFYLPKDETPGGTEAAYDVFAGTVGLAVDDHTGRIYTVIYDSVGEEEESTRQAAEIVDWSTTPNGSDQLIAPSGSSTTDSPSTPIKPVAGYGHPGVLSTSSQLDSLGLYEPQGLTLDVTGGKDYLAVQADAKTRIGSRGTPQGPVLVEQISTESGGETASWSSASLTSPSVVTNASSEDATATAAGISTNPDGSLTVLLATTEGVSHRYLDDIDLPASLSDPTVLASKAIQPSAVYNGGVRYPSAALPDNPTPLGVSQPEGGLGRVGDSSDQAVELSNGLYASDFIDGGEYWAEVLNEGIRLVQPEADGLLSNPLAPVTSIFDTLGNATPGTLGGACYIGVGNKAYVEQINDVTLAAGADGTIWALTEGTEAVEAVSKAEEGKFLTGREVIEFAPGASKTCAQPAGTFSLAKEGETPVPAASSLTIGVGSTVDFDASAIEYPANDGGKQANVYAYEWDLTGASSGGPGNDGYTIVNDTLGGDDESTHVEPTTASHTYRTPGEYTVGLKLLGDLGEYDETRTVIVQTSEPPTGLLTVPAEAQAGQNVSFSAVGSAPANGQKIANYHWSFGDGLSDDTPTESDTHEYSSPGIYTVTLTVRDKDNRESVPVTQKITITSPPPSNENTGGGSTGGGTITTSVVPVSPVMTTPPAKTSSAPKSLTTAQKLAAALKTCKKDKSKSKRATCEKQAKKKYAAKPKPKAKSKKKSGKKK
jgi:PKD repeat protein